jgi:hypothetical protein
MGNVNSESGGEIPEGTAGEADLRGAALDGAERKKSVAHTASDKARNTDSVLRLDGEEDTLYEDGLELEDDSKPLTGIGGTDDTQ